MTLEDRGTFRLQAEDSARLQRDNNNNLPAFLPCVTGCDDVIIIIS